MAAVSSVLSTTKACAIFCSLALFSLSLAAPRTSAAEGRPDPGASVEFLENLFAQWAALHEARGGDTNVGVLLSELGVFSARLSVGVGVAQLDFVNDTVAVQVADADPEVLDVWLVDNRPRSSVLPDDGDTFLYIGRMQPVLHTGQYALEADLTPEQIEGFDIDLVVVTKNDMTPVAGSVLFGRVPFFNRTFLERRLRKRLDAAKIHVPAVASFETLVAEGFMLFRDETFGGNGRTCASCHRIQNGFTIDAEFIAKLPADDPLFVHETNEALTELESPQMLRQLGLIRTGVDGPDVPPRLRAVPSIRGIATSLNLDAGDCARNPFEPDFAKCGFPPNIGPFDLRGRSILFGPAARARIRENLALAQSTGWSGDGAPHDGSLLNFAVGAIAQHFTRTMNRQPGIDFREPTGEEADALLAFQLALGRQSDPDTSAITFLDAGAARGFDLFNHAPGGCLDEAGVSHCGCTTDIHGNPCGLDVPNIPNGAGCASCHSDAGANVDLTPLPNVANHINLNFDIGTADRQHVVADEITAAHGETRPLDCGLGRLGEEDFEGYCIFPVSWPPYVVNAPCEAGPQSPPKNAFCPDPQGNPTGCTGACGFPGAPECNGWFDTAFPEPGQLPQPGRNPFEVFNIPNGWYFGQGSLCDGDALALPLPIITTGVPSQEACESGPFGFSPAEWDPNGGIGGAPACKCVDNRSCGPRQFCMRQEHSPVDGWCLGLQTPKTPFDPGNAEHVARAGNRVMVEPSPPLWQLLPTFGDACFNAGDPNVPSGCFGPLMCAGPPVGPGMCSEDPNWQPEVLSFCEVTESYPNPALALGCFPGSPNPACLGCQAYCPPGVPGCTPCFLPGSSQASFERACAAEHNPAEPALAGFGDGTFATPSLIEAADTSPYFHDHSAPALEDAIAHYATDQFNDSPGPKSPNFAVDMQPVHLDEQEVADLAAYLRVINAVENINSAQDALEQAWFGAGTPVGAGRLAFADAELEDAIGVLEESNIHAPAQVRLAFARKHLARAFAKRKPRFARRWRTQIALAAYHIAPARESMVIVGEAAGDLFAEPFAPDRADIRTGTLGGELQAAEEAAFAARLAELGLD